VFFSGLKAVDDDSTGLLSPNPFGDAGQNPNR